MPVIAGNSVKECLHTRIDLVIGGQVDGKVDLVVGVGMSLVEQLQAICCVL